ncbi:hypothetical protein TBLA_0A09780 [Henningerozyma blattae CBS 6284]|uniref:Uncharacterized protein n=1 Tax=Henningerozyma blattae (strain ATCC 34711 / CBS 6284 / DSM 70876 / NBRC 10599 / NRRL Y-10934 / UCD 77-7) TaxID=1071380 RepID=I2GXA9_HENB6|nr:hypothetical protein TBLA_0A09780 [Tetrapisispora blattae CBS 6284]CCH58761.1 hypothetical protein TBLA_0A09780 [Tetrapisispora blattae CBS 6284]
MKLKLALNASESPEDYKLLKTTLQTVASLRKTAVLRFNDERLIIISTPKSLTTSSSTILHGDTGQLWCTIPNDVFKLYVIKSARDKNCITMEYNCESLLNVFKRYDKVMNQGYASNMTIKLQNMPEWNIQPNLESNPNATHRSNPIQALGITFDEYVVTNSVNTKNDDIETTKRRQKDNKDDSTSNNNVTLATNKKVLHSFQIPVKLLLKSQDEKIKEPLIDYKQLMMYKLPPVSGIFGNAFKSFIRRIDRYSTVNHIRLCGIQKNKGKNNINEYENIQDSIENVDIELKTIVNELDWNLDITWNGPLEPIFQEVSNESQMSQTNDLNATPNEYTRSPHKSPMKSPIKSPIKITTKDTEPVENPFKFTKPLTKTGESDTGYDSLRIEESRMSSWGHGNESSEDTEIANGTMNNDEMDIDHVPDNHLDSREEYEDASKIVEEAEQENAKIHEVYIRSKDWKVCSRLYVAFEEIVLAIYHDTSCILHCALDRGSIEDTGDTDGISRNNTNNEKVRERGQIIYYIARSKPL